MDKERLDWIEEMTHQGHAPQLLYDDDGRFALSFTGMSPVVMGEGGHEETVVISGIVQPDEWKNSIREAIDYAKEKLHRLE